MTDLLDRLWQVFRDLLARLGSGAGDIIGLVQSLDPLARALIAGLAALLETNILTGLFVPGETIVIVAAAAVANPGEGVLLGACVAAGAFLGELSGYALGRWLGSPIRRSWLGRRIGEPRWTAAERFLDRRGGAAILSARFLPVLRTVMPFLVGVGRFPLRRFVAWSLPACVAWAALYVAVFSIAAAPLRDPSASVLAALAFAALGVIVFVVAFLVQRGLDRAAR